MIFLLRLVARAVKKGRHNHNLETWILSLVPCLLTAQEGRQHLWSEIVTAVQDMPLLITGVTGRILKIENIKSDKKEIKL